MKFETFVTNPLIKYYINNYKDFFNFGKEILKAESSSTEKMFYDLYINLIINNKSLLIIKDTNLFYYLLKSNELSKHELELGYSYSDVFSLYEKENLYKIYTKAEDIINLLYNIKTNKTYFEILPWIYQMVSLLFRVYIIIEEMPNKLLFDIGNNIIDIKNIIYKKNLQNIIHKNNIQNLPNFISDFLLKDKYNILFRNIIRFNFHSIRLDFVSSGIQLVGFMINDDGLLIFSNAKQSISVENKTNDFGNQLTSYNIILNVLLKNYKEQPDYLYINSFLHYFSDDIKTQDLLRNFILSRKTVKEKVMLEAYSGTLQGFKEKLKKKIKDFTNNNLILLPGDQRYFNILDKMCMALAKELNKLMLDKFPSIKNIFIKSIRDIVKNINMIEEQGVIVKYPHITYKLAPNKIISFMHKTNKFDRNINKLVRDSRRTLAYYSSIIDTRKITSSLGANIIQGMDSLVLYYFNEIIRLLTPDIHTSALHDAKIFGNTFNNLQTPNISDSDTVKDIFRISIYLSFKVNILNTTILNNKYDINLMRKFKTTFTHHTNIFANINRCKFESLFDSQLLNYILSNSHRWFLNTKEYNTTFFYSAYMFFNKIEHENYIQFLKRELNLLYNLSQKDKEHITNNLAEENHTLFKIQKILITKFITEYVIEIKHDFLKNMSHSYANSLINQLRSIINNNNFMKF